MYKLGIDTERKLIVITGLSGSGKSTLANTLSEYSGIEMYSLDTIKEKICDDYGFTNVNERHILTETAKSVFKAELLVKVRKGNSVIIEHPFSSKWQDFFNHIRNQYGYTLVVINCVSRDFENIWNAKIMRDRSYNRHLAHSAKRYIKNCIYEPDDFLYDDTYKDEEKRKFKENVYTSLKGDFVFADKELRRVLFKRKFESNKYVLLNLNRNINIYQELVENWGIEFLDIVNDIKLLDTTSYNLVDLSTPILYLVDSFDNIMDNKLWHHLRSNSNDVVIDSYGNMVFLQEIAIISQNI